MNTFEDSDEDLKFPNSYYNCFEELYGLSREELEAMLESERPYAAGRLKKACARVQGVDYRAARKTNKSTRKRNDHEVLRALSTAHTSLGYALQEWNRICLMERVLTKKQGEEKKAKQPQS
jgi:hypothetical protein